jgi:hypothetical protein
MKISSRVPADRRPEERPADERLSAWAPAKVECYSGYRADETPRSVCIGGKRFEISEVVLRKRLREKSAGRELEIFRCRLPDGRRISLERSADGSWRARGPADLFA